MDQERIGVLLERLDGKLDSLKTETAAKLDSIKQQLDAQGSTINRHDDQIAQLRDRTTTLEATRPKNVASWVATIIALIAVGVEIISVILH